jgi:hypothetical protein
LVSLLIIVERFDEVASWVMARTLEPNNTERTVSVDNDLKIMNTKLSVFYKNKGVIVSKAGGFKRQEKI